MARCTKTLAALAVALGMLPAGALGQAAPPLGQPEIVARAKPVITAGGLRFKDLNANGRLEAYEDWRLAPEARARDLVAKMTLAEKAGAMLIATNNPDCGGGLSPRTSELVDKQKMTRFILRAQVVGIAPDCNIKLTGFALRGGYPQTPGQMAGFTNAVQEKLEGGRLGIPGLFKDNPRNHVETDPRFGITMGGGSLTEFPKVAGLAAAALGAGAPVTRDGAIPADLKPDLSVVRAFTDVMGAEWKALGLRGMYGYVADLGTEPRWHRFHETATEDSDLAAAMMRELIVGLQGPARADGTSLSPSSAVALTIKHFPGGGPQDLGLDPHYTFGKNQVYRDPRYGFGYALKPFEAAIAAGASSIMPYYGVPTDVTYEGVRYDQVGMAFSRQVVTDLLRAKLGFKGNVNSDSGVIDNRAWGFESFRTNPETGQAYGPADRLAVAIRGGTDVFSEFTDAAVIVDLVRKGRLNEKEHIDPAVVRLLTEQFQLGLFENPYVDAEAAGARIGTPAHREAGLQAQRDSVVLLQNRNRLLPLKPGAKVYVMGFKAEEVAAYGFKAAAAPRDADAVLIKVMVRNDAGGYASNDPATGGRTVPAATPLIDDRTGQHQATWGAQDPCVYEPGKTEKLEGRDPCLDTGLIFGGAYPWEADLLALSDIAKAESWKMTPSLADIQAAMREAGDPAKVVVSVYFRNPYVLDDASGVKRAGALVATFGVSDQAQLDVISGRAAPRGRLPFALPRTAAAVVDQNPDAPGYAETKDGALYPYGYGLAY